MTDWIRRLQDQVDALTAGAAPNEAIVEEMREHLVTEIGLGNKLRGILASYLAKNKILRAEVKRLRARLVVDDAMVERVAKACSDWYYFTSCVGDAKDEGEYWRCVARAALEEVLKEEVR